MQLKDNQMDDLFRKAAQDYPLRMHESHWDDISPLLLSYNNIITKKAAR